VQWKGSQFVQFDGILGKRKGREGAREEMLVSGLAWNLLRSSADRLWLVAGREIGLPNHGRAPAVWTQTSAKPGAQLLGNGLYGLSWLKAGG